MYLNSGNNKSIEEVGAANFFCVMNGELHTPYLSGSILPGIIRDSLIRLATEKLGIKVVEREIPHEELPDAEEVFCSGTAAVITPIGSISFEGIDQVFNNFEVGPVTQELYDLLTGIQLKRIEDPYGWVETIG